MNKRRLVLWLGLLISLLACNLGAAPPTQPVDLLATLSASTPVGGNTANPYFPATATSAFFLPTPAVTLSVVTATSISAPSSSLTNPPVGHIVYTCQVYKAQGTDQICIMNADGTGFRRLTAEDDSEHYYPSLSPDGNSVLYSAFRSENIYEIFEMNLNSGEVKQLTNKIGVANAPEVSPDGKSIVFTRWTAASNKYTIMLMDRNGQNVNNIPGAFGWDPTWSPDGKYVLFASDMNGSVQLYAIRTTGKELHQVSNLPAMRGRSDWSADGRYIVTYSGEPWKREVYIMGADGSSAHVLSPTGGNSQGPSISPNGQWVAFTAYFDHPNEDNGCEIYIMRIDGTDLRRLTNNDYCDYQPRWGP
ncbi:MAG: hypothetical protein U0Z26_16995 [Anaerolineales bacterium]